MIDNEKSLADVFPDIAKEWHPIKNDGLTPYEVRPSSKKKVWWLGNCNHEWIATINSRCVGKGCPYCSNVKVLSGFNDLQSQRPELIEEWNWEKNDFIKPDEVIAGSHKHVWWKCSSCGNEWVAEVRQRSKLNQGCPICAKSKRTMTFRKNMIASGRKTLDIIHPEIAIEWHPTKNNTAIPSEYTCSSNSKIWWKCHQCGYEWCASINNRVNKKSGCPLCSNHTIVSRINDFETLYPQLANEWHPTKNQPLTPKGISPFSKKKIWWICKYGHMYQCRIADRQKGVGCSECSKRFRTSLPEKIVEYYIKKSFPNSIGNYRPDFLLGAEIDIYIPECLTGIEYDGQRYHQNVDRDIKKDKLCMENGVRLIRIREQKCPVYNRTDDTFIINGQNDKAFSKVINAVINELGGSYEKIDVSKDKEEIVECFRNTTIKGNIAEVYPDLAKEWHPTLNGLLKPENIPSTKSKDKYYWKCNKCGYTWEAILGERITGTGCPVCAGKNIKAGYNDLETTHPELAAEWHPTKNSSLTPREVSKGQKTTVWWKCSKCGHEWKTRISHRVAGSGCVKCAQKRWGIKQCKPVYQFSTEGKYIKMYDSARKAATELGVSRSSIQHACSGIQKTAGGFCWSYKK